VKEIVIIVNLMKIVDSFHEIIVHILLKEMDYQEFLKENKVNDGLFRLFH
jgi:hypothetical protein